MIMESVSLGRIAITNVTCGAQYSWMDNSIGQSPCLVAVMLYASCFASGWIIAPLANSSLEYTPPSPSAANCCACSWSVYNLIGACTACQDIVRIPSWNNYSINCGNYLTNTSFPINMVIPLNRTLLPYWAATNPMTWTNGKFNVNEAQAIHHDNHPDIDLSIPTTLTATKSTSIGAIAGGAIGSVIGAALVAIAIFFYLRYGKKIYKRVVFDASEKAPGPGMLVGPGYAPTPVSTVYSAISPTNPFIRTQLYQIPQSTMVRMSVQRPTNDAAMNTSNDVVSHFAFSSTIVDSNGRPNRRMSPIYEESTHGPTSTRQLNRHTYNESVSNEREGSALLSAHSPTSSMGGRRVHEPRVFYEFGDGDDGGAWGYRGSSDKSSWSPGAIWRRIWSR